MRSAKESTCQSEPYERCKKGDSRGLKLMCLRAPKVSPQGRRQPERSNDGNGKHLRDTDLHSACVRRAIPRQDPLGVLRPLTHG